MPIGVTFDEVLEGGITSVMTAPAGPPPPQGFKLGTPPIYYDVTTTVRFTGTCISFSALTSSSVPSLPSRPG